MSTHAENVKQYRQLQRDTLIASAVQTRKIAPDRAEDYKRMWDADPKGIHHLLTAPVAQGGLLAGNAAAFNPLPPVEAAYPAEWLPETRPRGQVNFEDGAVHTVPTPAPAAPSVPGRVTMEPGL